MRQRSRKIQPNSLKSSLKKRVRLVGTGSKGRLFQGAHDGALPSQQASNLQILSGLQAQLQGEQDALNAAKQQRVYYQSLIEQYKNAQHPGDRWSSDGTARNRTGTNTLQAQLADLSSRYTDPIPMFSR